MERQENNIVFTIPEQETFSLPPVVTVESALDTADAFTHAAGVVDGAACDEVVGNEHSFGVTTDLRILRQRERAAELMSFAAAVYNLCPDEQLERIANSSDL